MSAPHTVFGRMKRISVDSHGHTLYWVCCSSSSFLLCLRVSVEFELSCELHRRRGFVILCAVKMVKLYSLWPVVCGGK